METKNKAVVKTVYDSVLKIIYTIFLGIFIALFFGLGVAAFYPSPKAPEYPAILQNEQYKSVPSQQTPEQLEAQKTFDAQQKEYQAKSQVYSRDVSIITLICAVIVLVVSLLFLNKILLLSDGLMLGGVFTLIYSTIRGMMTEDVRYRFVVVSIGLLITLVLGYIKFIKKEDKSA